MRIRSIRRALSLAAAFALSVSAGAAIAQDWPTKPITAVVPLGAGSASDIVARVVMDQVSKQIGQPVVVENRPGAGGTIGANAVAKAAPDGYTVLIYGALNTAHAMHTKLPYDTIKDFIPVISLGQQPLVIVTSPGKGYKTLKDMIAAGKAKPGSLNYSSVGVGSASHFGAERLRVAGGFEAQHLPFKGAADAVTDVVADRSDFSVQLTATTLPLIKDGKLVPLAVSAHKRIPALPDTPTTIELGLPPESVYPFYTGVYVPANTPKAVVDRLYREIAKALEAPAVQARFATLGVQPMPGSQAEFTKFFHDDVNATVALAKAAKIQPQ
jgi:tripartite-type tricarboxylate transporter receptor subunit TctC